ncbi:MAG: AAA family ATPase [Candidatus Methanomethylophilaceae archaeon]|nr:AAA family ATPase [Candidatus Methanomethylophilaceae archaeon]
MKLTSVHVKGLFATFDHTINLRPEGLTFIHSPNGLGKSTLVRMIYDLFRGDLENLAEVPFERAEFVFDDDMTLILIPDHEGMGITLEKNEIVNDVSEPEARSLLDVTYVGPRRLYIPNLDGTYRSAISVYSEQLADKLRNAQEALAADPWELPSRLESQTMDADELLHWAKELKARVDFMRDAGLEVSVPSPHRFPPRPIDIREDREGNEILMDHISAMVDRHYRLAESVTVYQDIVNSMFIGKNIRVDDQQGIRVLLSDGSQLDVERLSSGETQLLLILYRLLFNASSGSLVILDEPEISLHVSWQQKLSSILLDISRLRQLQIIVATHSPQIVHDKWDLTEELRAEIA